MQAPRADLLTPFQKDEILATITDGLDDDQLKTSITLKQLTSKTTDLETGIISRTSTDDVVDSIAREVTAREVAQAGTLLELGDRVYLVDKSDVTNDLSTVDRVVDGSDSLEVITFKQDPLGHMYQIWARRV